MFLFRYPRKPILNSLRQSKFNQGMTSSSRYLYRPFSGLVFTENRSLKSVRPELFFSIVADVEKYPKFIGEIKDLYIKKK